MPDLSKPSKLERLRGGKAQVAGGVVDRDGGDNKAGLISGYAVITRGEALGHGAFVDGIMLRQVAEGINAAGSPGVKSRFTHPSLSGDGLGKFLGRTKNARIEGNIVRGDLHFSDTAHDTPSGDLAKYVMDLAESDPKAFAASITFERDRGAEDKFTSQHEDENGTFKSPDSDNKKNLRHFRVLKMHGSDIVDEPAANPGGLFSAGLAGEADALCEYALGLSDEEPELNQLSIGIDAERLRGFAGRFLATRGLQITSKEPTVAETKDTAVSEPKTPELKPPVISDDEMLRSGRQIELNRVKALSEKYPKDPGFVLKCLNDGLSIEQADSAGKDRQIETLSREVGELKKIAQRGGEGVEFGGGGNPGGKSFMGEAERIAKESGGKLSMTQAMRQLAASEPELYAQHVAAIPQIQRKRG